VRIAVTGIASDFGTVIAPLLFGDDDVEEVVGIDLREPRVDHPKLRFEREDVRSHGMRELFADCEAIIHLAFVVSEIHDKERTHSINLGGSKNVIAAAAVAGAKRLVIASSVASYGVHPDHPTPITEDEFPRGNPDKYYFYDKAEVEHYIEWWEQRNPDTEMLITRIRPPFIVGPHLVNSAIDRFTASTQVLPGDSTSMGVQLLWEDDLAQAFYLAAKNDAPGAFNVGTDDWFSVGDFADLHGQRLHRLSLRAAVPLAEIMFRLRLSPVSSHWVIAGEGIVSSEKIGKELGWKPRFSSAESARMLLIQNGRPILPGRSDGVFARKEVAEETLESMTATLRTWSRSIAGFGRAVDGPADVDRMADRVEHVLMPYKDRQLHLEVQTAGDGAPTIVFSPGIGGYARFYLPVLGKLCDEGFNVVGIDRPGHGLSEGRRGDCTIEQILDVVEDAARYARERFGGPVVLMGSSLGGIITWYSLTREPDVEAVVCHNVAHPSVYHEPAARPKAAALKRLRRIAPYAGIPIKQIANFEEVAQSPEVLDYFRSEPDRTWCWKISARSAASLFEYEPPVDWSQVSIPALVLVGGADDMVSAAFTERVVQASTPPNSEVRVMAGMGHMVFLEHLDEVLPQVIDWTRERLESYHAAPVGAGT
jgi:nucleoside-diphosphate-sugar epimerase